MSTPSLMVAALSLAGAAVAAAQTPPAPPLNAKVTETLMGPSVMGGSMTRTYLSADGDHLAIIAAKGSRQVVLLDGVEGPAFDEISTTVLDPSRPLVQWSPTGGHSGYIGRRGGDYIAVIDGKEVGTAATQTGLGGGTDPSGWRFWFSKDGTHVAYATIAPGVSTMVVDGVPGQRFLRIDFRQTAFNGNRLVYVGQSAEAVFRVVVDGKPGPVYADVRDLTLTPDGAHHAFFATLPGVAGPQRSVVVVDGVVSPAYFSASALEQAPDGRVAYVASTQRTDPLGELIVGGTSTPNPTTFNIARQSAVTRLGYEIRHVAWSPDGKGFAFVRRLDPNPGVQVIANGKPVGLTYQTANQLRWSPDGGTLFFLAGSPTATFPVVNGTELDAVGSADEFQFSPDSKHYAFQVYLGTPKIVVDGKDQPKAIGFMKGSLRFSPDSKHVVYGAQTSILNYQLVKDGVTQPGILVNFMAMNRVQPPITFPPILFSPDGSRMAWVGMKDATTRSALAVDGVYYPAPTPNFMFPSFSPDSKHFAALTTGNTGWAVMVDGKLGPSYEDIVPTSAAGFRFTDGHTYRFYGIKAGQIYRVTIDLGS